MCDGMRCDDDDNMEQNLNYDGKTIRFRTGGTGESKDRHRHQTSPHGDGRVENVDAVRYKSRSSASQDSKARKQRTYARARMCRYGTRGGISGSGGCTENRSTRRSPRRSPSRTIENDSISLPSFPSRNIVDAISKDGVNEGLSIGARRGKILR